MYILLAVIPTVGVISVKICGEKCVISLAEVINDLILTFEVIQVNLNSLFMIIMDDRISLNFFVAQVKAHAFLIYPFVPGLMPWDKVKINTKT